MNVRRLPTVTALVVCALFGLALWSASAQADDRNPPEREHLGKRRGSSSPSGISCPNTCSVEFKEGEKIFLTEEPEEGYEFLGWIGCFGSEEVCEIKLPEMSEVIAVFVKEPKNGEKGEKGKKARRVKRVQPAPPAKLGKRARRAKRGPLVGQVRPVKRVRRALRAKRAKKV